MPRGSLVHLVGAAGERLWHGDSERVGCLEVDYQLELGGLLDRNVGWLGTLEDSINKGGRPAIHVRVSRAIPDQGTLSSRHGPSQYHPEAKVHPGFDEPISVPVGERAGLNDDCLRAALFHRGQYIIRFGDVGDASRTKLNAGR